MMMPPPTPVQGAWHAFLHHRLHQPGPDGAAANGQRRAQCHATGFDAGKKAEVVDRHASTAKQDAHLVHGLAGLAFVHHRSQQYKKQSGHDHAQSAHPVGRELRRCKVLGGAGGAP
jgi:hypothetical protein